MIVWNGLGILVVIIWIGAILIVGDVASAITGIETEFSKHSGRLFLGCLLAALLVFFLHLYLASRETNTVIDKATGQEYELGRSDSLFFIPVKWWPIIIVIIGIINFVK